MRGPLPVDFRSSDASDVRRLVNHADCATLLFRLLALAPRRVTLGSEANSRRDMARIAVGLAVRVLMWRGTTRCRWRRTAIRANSTGSRGGPLNFGAVALSLQRKPPARPVRSW